MTSVRRWYMYISATIGLQVLVWALIGLLRGILATSGEAPGGALALQISLIIVGLPFWLVHWLWSERIAARAVDERASVLRRLYLLGNTALFLLAIALNIKSLLLVVLSAVTGIVVSGEISEPLNAVLHATVGLVILGLFSVLNLRAAQQDQALTVAEEGTALVRRLYFYLIALVALSSWATAAANLVRLVALEVVMRSPMVSESDVLRWSATLLVAVGFWIIAWQRVQQLHAAGSTGERESLVRYLYLYLWIVVGALTALGNAVRLIDILLSWALGLELDISYTGAIAWGLLAIFVWFYHNRILLSDAKAIAEEPRQAGIRRLAWYLIAAIGQAASLFALGALLTLLIRALLVGGPGDLRGILSGGIAALAVGVPTWLVLWRRIEADATSKAALAEGERNSLVRRIYLFGFVFAAALTVLGSLIFVVYRPLSIVLGGESGVNLAADMLQALTYALIAGGVLVAHGRSLQRDSAARAAAATERQRAIRTLVLNGGETGALLVSLLQKALPKLPLTLLDSAGDVGKQVDDSELVIGVWPDAAVPQAAFETMLQRAKRRVLVPIAGGSWDWAGVTRYDAAGAADVLTGAVEQFIAGKAMAARTKLSPLAVFGLIVAGVILAVFLLQLGVALVLGSM